MVVVTETWNECSLQTMENETVFYIVCGSVILVAAIAALYLENMIVDEVLCSMQFRQQLMFVSLHLTYQSHCHWISIVVLLWELWETKKRAESEKELTDRIAEVSKLKNEREKELAGMNAGKKRVAKLVEELADVSKLMKDLDVVLVFMIEEATNVMKKKELSDRAEFEKELARNAEKKRVAELKKELEDSKKEVDDKNAEVFELERTRSIISGRLLELRKEKLVLEKELADMNVEKEHVAALKKELADRNAEVSKVVKELENVLDVMIEEATKVAEEKEMAYRAAMEKELALNAEKKLAVELKQELADRNAEVAKLMTENEKALADKNAEKKRVAELEKQLADMNAEVWKLVEKCEEELA